MEAPVRRAGDLLALLLLAACRGDKAPFPAGDDSTPTGGDDTAVDSPDSGDDTADSAADDTASADCADLLWYPDDDGDLFGRTVDAVCAAEAPDDDYVLDPDDCDDADALVHPLADDPCDGTDYDCDGELYSDWCDGGLAAASVWWYAETLSDQAGSAVHISSDLNGDGVADLLVAARFNDDAAENAGAVFAVYGPATAGGALSTADAVITGRKSRDELAESLLSLPDQDGDGFGELLLGAPSDDTAATDGGGVFLFSGPLASRGDLGDADAALSGLRGEGTALAVGDLDGDGALELAIAAEESVTVSRPPDPAAGWAALGDGLARMDGLGWATGLLMADLDGDGLDELLIGDALQSRPLDEAGAVYVFAGPLAGALLPADAVAVWSGAAESERAGWALGAADLDGDGRVEALATSYGAGLVAVLDDSLGLHSLSAAPGTIIGSSEDGFGSRVVGAGDLDGDSFEDLVIAAPLQDDPWANGGGCWVVRGPVSGAVAVADVGDNLGGPTNNGLAGSALAVGDLDGDGHPDLAVGEPRGSFGLAEGGAVGLLFDLGL